MKFNKLKTINPYFTEVWNDIKTFEVRKNDRNFEVDDLVLLMYYNPSNPKNIQQTPLDRGDMWHDHYILGKITYVLTDLTYCKPLYCIFSLEIINRGIEKNLLEINGAI